MDHMIESRNVDTSTTFWLGVGFAGGFFTAVFMLSVCLALGAETQPVLRKFVYDWQALIAAGLALVSALLTIAVIWKQITQAQAQEVERRYRTHYAARSVMPAALVELLEYTEGGQALLKSCNIPDTTSGRILHEAPWTPPTLPVIPTSAVSTLKVCIESANLTAMPIIADLLNDLQILNSRLNAIIQNVSPGSNHIVLRYNLTELIIFTLAFHVRCSKLLYYARRKDDEIQSTVGFEEMTTRAFFAKFHEEDYPGLEAEIKRRYGGEPEVILKDQ